MAVVELPVPVDVNLNESHGHGHARVLCFNHVQELDAFDALCLRCAKLLTNGTGT